MLSSSKSHVHLDSACLENKHVSLILLQITPHLNNTLDSGSEYLAEKVQGKQTVVHYWKEKCYDRLMTRRVTKQKNSPLGGHWLQGDKAGGGYLSRITENFLFFQNKGFRTWLRFESEVFWDSEMAYWSNSFCVFQGFHVIFITHHFCQLPFHLWKIFKNQEPVSRKENKP